MVKLFDLKGKAGKEVKLPAVFETTYRPDLIRRAVLSEQSKKKQKQGRFPLAGRRVAAASMGPGRGASKVPRSTGSGTHHGGRGTLIHSTVGGRMLFPPSTDKKIVEKMNKKERRLALKSAIAATSQKELVLSRGHKAEDVEETPIVVKDSIMEISKTKELLSTLQLLGLGNDLERTSGRKIRAGKGKMRGRKYKTKTGPLLVVTEDCPVMKAGNNILGFDIVTTKQLSVEKLAPGGDPARFTIWTEGALEHLKEL